MRDKRFSKILPLVALGFGLSACDNISDTISNLDFDLRNNVGGLDTSNAARQAVLDRPAPDARGVISYPNYQVAVAKRGDTVASLSARVGGNASEIAAFNGLRPDDTLNAGIVVALPGSVPAPAVLTPPGGVDITEIATTAIDNAPSTAGSNGTQIARAQPSKRIDGPEPIRHQVKRGETAFTIARLYKVSVRSLADWNGLGPDLEVREDQYLLIPVVDSAQQAAPVTATPAAATPGQGTATPVPPSADKPLPEPVAAPKPAPAAPTQTAAAPAAASKAAFSAPVGGKVIRPYKKNRNEGIDIAAAQGTAVKAAADGTVAAITRDTEQVPILVLRHANNVLTVYANISDISVKKGDRISRGQSIAKVGPGDPAFLHFEVREGFESVNPAKYLQ